jgi:hypothetical protein
MCDTAPRPEREPSGPPAWNTLPRWYLLGTEDKATPPQLQRFMAERANATIVEVAASHVSFVSQPEVATHLILQPSKQQPAPADPAQSGTRTRQSWAARSESSTFHADATLNNAAPDQVSRMAMVGVAPLRQLITQRAAWETNGRRARVETRINTSKRATIPALRDPQSHHPPMFSHVRNEGVGVSTGRAISVRLGRGDRGS